MSSLVIYGCGGHARSIADVAILNHYTSILFVDPNAKPNEMSLGFEVTTTMPSDAEVIIGIGDNQKRAASFETLIRDKVKLTSLISHDAHVGKDAKLAAGVFVARGVHIGPNANIQENTLLNTYAVIEHDVEVGKHCHVSVNAVIAGKSRIGDFVLVGSGATIIDNIVVCSNVLIGAGAVVVKDITEPGTYVGIPAKFQKF